MAESFFDKLRDWWLFKFEKSPTVAFAKSSKGNDYRDMIFDMAGNSPIPPEVWDSIPDKLKKILDDAQKDGAKITYEPNSQARRGYDRVTVRQRKGISVLTTSYNTKNGVKTYLGSYSGPLSSRGMFFDPETGESGGMIIS